MANQEHLAVLQEGVQVWNEWRQRNRDTKIDLRETILKEADLSGFNLKFANLSNADLSSANLSNADLSNAILSEAILRSANLSSTNLRGADLSLADLSLADLSLADLTRAELSGANLKGVDLSRTDLTGVDLRGVRGLKTKNTEAVVWEKRNNKMPVLTDTSTLTGKDLWTERRRYSGWEENSSVKNFLLYFGKLPYYLFFILFLTLFLIILINVFRAFVDGVGLTLISELKSSFEDNYSIELIFLFLLSPFVFFITIMFIVNLVLCGLYCSDRYLRSFFEWIIRFLGALPTLLLGNTLIVLADLIRVNPQESIIVANPIFILFFIFLVLVLIAIPTALQIGQELLADYETQNNHLIEGIVSVAATKMEVVIYFILPRLIYGRTLFAGIVMAIGRVAIEGYIVLNNQSIVISDTQTLRDIFYNLYSTTTIENNIVIIILLLFFAVIANLQLYIAIHNK